MNRRINFRQRSRNHSKALRIALILCIVLGILQLEPFVPTVDAKKEPTRWHRFSVQFRGSNKLKSLSVFNFCRGGATTSTNRPTSSTTKKKKTKKKSKPNPELSSKETQEVVNQKLKEKDTAQALGDAIRERARALRFGSIDQDGSPTSSATRMLESVGYAMGASDFMMATSNVDRDLDESDAAIAEELIDPTAVIVQYFLRSHGGAHAFQCICSLFATLAGVAGCLISGGKRSDGISLQLIFIRRCMMFAFCKHAFGLLAAAYSVALAIPATGFQQAVSWMQTMTKDPVSQYLFYAAVVFLWVPSTSPAQSFRQNLVAESPQNHSDWWQAYSFIPLVLVGPVVIREFISIALVVTDVLVLIVAATSSKSATRSNGMHQNLKDVLLFLQAFVDSLMSLVVTPQVWRSSTALQRQGILAKLTSKISVTLEVVVGILITTDALIKTVSLLFLNTGSLNVFQLIKSCILARLYLQFLFTRRKKIAKLAASVRGGALSAPIYLLDILLDPTSSMGLPTRFCKSITNDVDDDARSTFVFPKWLDYVRIALDISE